MSQKTHHWESKVGTSIDQLCNQEKKKEETAPKQSQITHHLKR